MQFVLVKLHAAAATALLLVHLDLVESASASAAAVDLSRVMRSICVPRAAADVYILLVSVEKCILYIAVVLVADAAAC